MIRPPALSPAHHGERRVTWMELFYDLIFVAAVSQVGVPLAHDYSWAGVLRYSVLFVMIWSAWSGHTLFATRFQSDDWIQRALILVQCFVAAVMAANAKEGLDSVSAAGFGAAYAGIRLVLVVQYLRARQIRETRALTTRYAIGFGIAAVAWLVSAVATPPHRYWLWSLALTIDFGTQLVTAPHGRKFPPHLSHLPERFGLFTIILIGEFVAATMRGIESQETWTVPAFLTAFSSMAAGFLLWWLYFEVAKGADPPKPSGIWYYGHLPLCLAIGVAGVGFERWIHVQGKSELHPGELAILGTAVTLVLAGLLLVRNSQTQMFTPLTDRLAEPANAHVSH
jgi:low temperature requirement protein LtrA